MAILGLLSTPGQEGPNTRRTALMNMAPFGPKWPKMAQNGPKWPFLAILGHLGPIWPSGALYPPRGYKRGGPNGPRGPKWPKMAKNGQKWPFWAILGLPDGQKGPFTLTIYVIFGPLWPQGPKMAQNGHFWPFLAIFGPFEPFWPDMAKRAYK